MLDFNKCQDVVVEWQRIGNGGTNDISEPALIFQRAVCEEEWGELIDALNSGDITSILKEYSDWIVVGSYHEYLYERSNNYSFIDSCINGLYVCSQLNDEYEYESDEALLRAKQKAFDAVMESNYSKFPFISEIESPEQECKDIEERSNGRYTGITYKTVEDNEGNKRYVFKDSNGKIVKPKTYKEPVL